VSYSTILGKGVGVIFWFSGKEEAGTNGAIPSVATVYE
jgi:hypothetical protein